MPGLVASSTLSPTVYEVLVEAPAAVVVPAEVSEAAPQVQQTERDIVQVWGEDSFPASDPPANW